MRGFGLGGLRFCILGFRASVSVCVKYDYSNDNADSDICSPNK